MRAMPAFLLAVALLAQAGACAWNQTLDVGVSDQNGLPVAGADVKITYQKANGITGNDGFYEGKTGADGRLQAALSNTVPEGLESRGVKVEAGAYGWHSGARTVQANGGGTLAVEFAAPFELEKVTVIVVQANGAPARGAAVYISGSGMKADTDPQGKAEFYVPAGSEIVGFASYRNEGDYFTSENAVKAEGGGREILVRLPQRQAEGEPEPEEGSTVLTVHFVSQGGEPAGGERVVFSHEGTETTAYTDALGAAQVVLASGGEVRASIRKNGYDYSFSFNVTADGTAKSETAALYPLLKIEYFESVADGPGCYRISAKVSDPRSDRPVSVKMARMQNGSAQPADLQVGMDENGMYSARVCAAADALVRVVASNAYDSVEKTISLSPAASQPQPGQGQQAAVPNATGKPALPGPVHPPSPSEGLEAIVVGIALLAIVLGAAAVIVGRGRPAAAGGVTKYFAHAYGVLLGSAVRPILEYLRSVLRRRERPPTFTPPPQGPMMPPA